MLSYAINCFLCFSLFCLLDVSVCAIDCTNSYVILQGPETNCVHVSQNSSVIFECVLLSDFIRDVGRSDCSLEVFFSQGQYVLTSYNIQINTSLTLLPMGPGAVTITCSNEDRVSSEINTTFWVNLNNDELPSGYVEMRGIYFEKCAYQVRIDYAKELVVDNCTFKGFKSSGLDVYNCLDVIITNSTFLENNVTTFNDRYRGDAAGLSIAHNFPRMPPFVPTLIVRGCEFRNNKAAVRTELSDQIDKALNDNTYPARGGGLSLIIIEDYTYVTAIIDSCFFENNFADAFGGAAYMIVSGQSTSHSITFSNTKFINSTTHGGGGAIFIGYLSTNLHGTPTITEFSNVLFENNVALTSGGVLVLQTERDGNGDFAIFKSCNFSGNVGTGEGAAIVFGSLQKVQSRTLFRNFSKIHDCVFRNNTSNDGIVIAGFTKIIATGTSHFIDNHGPALRITGALLDVKGNVTFTGNRGTVSDRAAMYITALGQVRIHRNSHLTFSKNYGSIGAAIRVQSQRFSKAYLDVVDNPLCFLQYGEYLPPSQWEENLINFHGNVANLGSAIFASFFEFCSYDIGDNDTTLFDVKQFKHWPVFNFSVNYNRFHIEIEDPKYYIQTPAESVVAKENQEIFLRPNYKGKFNLTGMDQFGNPTLFVAKITDKDDSLSNTLVTTLNVTESFEPLSDYSMLYEQKNVPILQFSPNLVAINPRVPIATEYSLQKRNSKNYLQYEDIKQMLIEVQNSNGVVYDTVEIQITTERCLPGYELQPSQTDPGISNCECIGAENNEFAVLDCDEQRDRIILRNGYWSGRSDGNDYHVDPYLAVYTCPITYCQCQKDQFTESCIAEYNLLDINLQCYPPRQGPLCGTCGNGSVVSVLRFRCFDHCYADGYAFYYATATLIVVDSIVIVLVLLISMKYSLNFPNKLKAILFYIQTVYVATEYFPITFWNSRQYMLYWGNLLSLYFPFDFCFLANVPSVLSFISRFIPVTLMVIIGTICFSFRKARRRMWHGVWMLTLLLYPSLVYACVMLLNCPSLPDIDGSHDVPRWFLDASIMCFRDTSHFILGILGLLVLIVLVLLIPMMAILMITEHSSFVQEHYTFLAYLLDTLKAGYRPNLHWMSCVELIKRLLIIGIVIATPGRTVIPIYIVTFFFVIHLYIMPYNEFTDNVFESVILLNYIVLLAFRFCQSLLDNLDSYTGVMVPSDSDGEIPQSIQIVTFFELFFFLPIIITVIVFIIYVTQKTWKYVKKRWTILATTKRRGIVAESSEFDKIYYRCNSTALNSSGKVIPVTNLDLTS